ncbi:unnamed protein product [Phytomonas sp. EM1]|nr:unnamed protein product [Phytomonas sp. EM1]|eukprot:CCW64884.1 unnamed protein product [Phytomonas sp. isolate EM1]
MSIKTVHKIQSHVWPKCTLGNHQETHISAFRQMMFSSPVTLVGAFHTSRLLRRSQTIKPNPFETSSGNFDKSFEKMVGNIEMQLPFRQHHFSKGYMYDRNFGEENADAMRDAAKADVHGTEPERPAAKQARSYFTDEDLSPEALHVRSPRLKVAQHIQRQEYDRSLLKTSSEPMEYYYPPVSAEEKRKKRMWITAGIAGGVGVVWYGCRRLGMYMRSV